MNKIDPLYELFKGNKLINTAWRVQNNGDYLVMENNVLKFYQARICDFVEPLGLFEVEGNWEIFQEN